LPYGRLAVTVCATEPRPSRSSSAAASAIGASNRATLRAQRRAAPVRSQIASTTDSSTVSPGNSVLIWNVRTRPRLTRSCIASRVTSVSPSSTRPAVGGYRPVSRLTSVVLPAPLGPISAWRAPTGSVRSIRSLT